MIAPLKLDDEVPPGESARQPYRRHARLGAGADAHWSLFDRAGAARDQLGQVSLCRGGRSEARTLCRGLLDRLHHWRKSVSQNHWAPRAEDVEIAVSFRVEKVRALGMGHELRIAAHSAEGPHRRVDAAREKFLGAEPQMTGQ